MLANYGSMTQVRTAAAAAAFAGVSALAVAGWTTALLCRRRSQGQVADLQARLSHNTFVDATTGLFNRQGTTLLAQRTVSMARRDSDAVSACLVLIRPRIGSTPSDDDVLTVAEAAEVTFRSADTVGRIAPDRLLVVGKGKGMQSGGVESRLVAQMVTMAAPGTIVPSIVVATASLQPWDEGDLLDLERLAEEDLEVRLAAAIPASPPPASSGDS